MTKKKRLQVAVAVVLLMLGGGGVWMTIRRLTRPSSSRASSRTSSSASPVVPTHPVEIAPPSVPSDSNRLPPDPIRDPLELPQALIQAIQRKTQMLQKSPEPETAVPINKPLQLELQGIFWGTPRPQAIINRQIVSAGDKFSGAEVVSISQDHVTLSVEGVAVVLKSPSSNHLPKKPEEDKR